VDVSKGGRRVAPRPLVGFFDLAGMMVSLLKDGVGFKIFKMGRLGEATLPYAKKAPHQILGAGLMMGMLDDLQRLVDEFLEFDDVGSEVADALCGFLGRHGVFVEHQAEGFFIE
jgi:hypothetical protein